MSVRKIVSGGQTGVDRAALDVAIELGIGHGGWCPAGRTAEDGILATAYMLIETPSYGYSQRTIWNVRDSDATIVFFKKRISGGSLLTAQVAKRLGRPLMVTEISSARPRVIQEWLRGTSIEVLNVAGPRESEAPGIYDAARSVLVELLRFSAQVDRS